MEFEKKHINVPKFEYLEFIGIGYPQVVELDFYYLPLEYFLYPHANTEHVIPLLFSDSVVRKICYKYKKDNN